MRYVYKFIYTKPSECVTQKVKLRKKREIVWMLFSSVYGYSFSSPNGFVKLLRCGNLTILLTASAITLYPISVKTSHSPSCVIIIYKCHFQICFLFTSCHSYPHLYMTFVMYFSPFLKQPIIPPTETTSLSPLTWLDYLAFLHTSLFKMLSSLVIICNTGLPYSRG